MKKALQISLARTLFTIEEDAYARLDTYLNSIRAALAGDAGKDEIVADVEGRIAEKFLESGKAIITMDEVSQVISSMGEASAFQSEPSSHDAGAGANASAADATAAAAATPVRKKLYRDPRNAMVGGVCSGLSAYFGIEVMWVRLLFIVAAFANGFGVLAYLVMWLIVPEAKSTAQRLEMEGVPVNLTTLAENAREMVDTGSSAAGRFVRAAFRVLFAVLRVAIGLFLIVTTLPVVLGLSVFVPFILANPGAPYFAFPLTDAIAAPVLWSGFIAAYFLAALPCMLLFLVAIGMLRRKPVLNARVTSALCALWAVALMVGTFSISRGISSGQAYVSNSPAFEEVQRTLTVTGPVRDVVVKNGMRVTLVQGEMPAMEVTGRAAELDTVRVSEKDGVLTISRERLSEGLCIFCDNRGVTVTLTVPQLEAVHASGGSRVIAEGWKSELAAVFEAANGSRIEIDGSFKDLHGSADGGSRLNVAGTVDTLRLTVTNGSNAEADATGNSEAIEATGGSHVDADRSEFKKIEVISRNGSRVEVGKSEELNVTATGGARVTYLGETNVTKSVSSGGSVYGVDVSDMTEDGTDTDTGSADQDETSEVAPESPEAPEAPAGE